MPEMTKKNRFTAGRWILALMLALILVAAYFILPWLRTRLGRIGRLREWMHDPSAHASWGIQAGMRCGDAPFLLPTSGFIGFIWGDSFYPGHQHQGIDVFGGDMPGKTPVLAASSGYLTRLPEWKSTVIIRIPSDPLNINRQIWIYYTHMANKDGSSYIYTDFPPGTRERFVEAGTFLGFQGDYSGNPGNPVGVHLHFSIVQDDGQGSFRNELAIGNTLDPSSYLGLPLNNSQNSGDVVTCTSLEGL